MNGTRVNPAAVRPGGKIATKWQDRADGSIQVIKTRTVNNVGFCNKPELVHLDHECYDTRFSTVVIPTK